MKISLYKYAAVILLSLPMILSAHDEKLKGKYTKEKTVKKEFSVNADALLKISNSYGNLNISSWNQNRVLIEVHIKTNGNNEEKVQRKLDEITIAFESSNSMVYAKTVFHKSKFNWGWGGNTNVNMQVNYTIKLPVKNSVNLTNDYGSIFLDRIDGHAKINCDYGRLEIGELRGRNNQLSFDYTSKSSIGYINSGNIKADYSGFTIEKAGDLIIRADYTNSTIEKIKNLQYTTDYGTIEIGEVHNIQGNGDYITLKLGTVHGNLDINSSFGSIRIDTMAEDAGNLRIGSDYTDVKIGYDPGYYFDFEIRTSYARLRGKNEFEINISTEKSNNNYYKGYYGKANSGNHIAINSDYGGISFTKN
ncbi:MAG: hypothetical protein QM485_09855 [Flavobacteriaceae bacterium]